MATPNGLNNTGNTCYLNSGTQMLLQNIDFCDEIITNRSINSNIEELAKFIESYYKFPPSNNYSVTPSIVKKIVGSKHNRFRGNQQQDAQDLINSLMDILNDYTSNKFSYLFRIESQQTLKCKLRTCLTKSVTKEINDFLILPISVNSTLDDCYREYKNHEKLEGENKYFCNNCKELRIASRRLEVVNWPKHLIIFLKRFNNNGERLTKNSSPIDIPINWRHGYTLKGCIIHTGNINGGHYFYISRVVKKDGSIHWYNCNDSSVTEINQSSAEMYMNKNIYIIYYAM